MNFIAIIIYVIAAYLLGSISIAVIISKRWYHSDIRTHGSGNAGSTNVYRTFGWKAGLIVQIGDILKGVFAALLPLIGNWLFALSPAEDIVKIQIACGCCAVIGHLFPIFSQFRGGKGMNTILGMMLVVSPWIALIAIGVFLLVFFASQYVSLASMLAVASFPIYVLCSPFYRENLFFELFAWFLFLLVVYTHRENIQRLKTHSERKVNIFGKKNRSIS